MQGIFRKLAADTGILLTDLWRACLHLPPRGQLEHWTHRAE
jgi:hypothetical protein